jgi:hypothetical protein
MEVMIFKINFSLAVTWTVKCQFENTEFYM